MDAEKIGKFIYKKRKQLNLTQSQLADLLLVTSQAVSKWENGRGIPDIEMLNALARVFHVELEEIINGEEKNKIEIIPPKKSKKKNKFLILGIILLCLIILLISTFRNEDNFNFQPLTSNNSCFGVKGVIAYNKSKKSIYISNIECSNEEKKEYLDIECILYETIGDTDKKIYEYGKLQNYEFYDKNNIKTLNDLLNDIEFNIDDYNCSCDKKNCDNLYIRINALNIDEEVVTYNIPIELENKCIN